MRFSQRDRNDNPKRPDRNVVILKEETFELANNHFSYTSNHRKR